MFCFRAGLLNINISLDLSLYMVNEHDYLPWNSLLANLGYIQGRIMTKPIYTDYKVGLGVELVLNMSCVVKNLFFWFPKRSDTNWAVQQQKMAGGLNIRI